jgi:transcriptional regulator with XRE-family HTH domain
MAETRRRIRKRVTVSEKIMSGPTLQERAEMVKAIGERMRKARELCNLSQSEAARRLGYQNSSMLSKVELATDSSSVPLWLIFRAAKVYEVSIDFLFGATDDWEVGARMTQERETSGWMFDAWEKARKREMEILKRLHDRVQTLSETVAFMLTASENTSDALARFVELNPTFEDMRAGAPLVFAVERAADAATDARAKMERFHMEMAVVTPSTHHVNPK